jgi:3-oxo-5alpha-steroid 4-dehydrogenase
MAIYQPLKKSAIKRGIAIQNHCKVVSLVTDAEDRVIGVKTLSLAPHSLAGLCHKALNSLQTLLRYTALYTPVIFPMFASLSEKIELKFGKTQFIGAKKGVVLATGGFYGNQSMVKEHAPKFVGGSPLGTMADDGSGIQMAQQLGAKTDLLDSVSAWRFFNPPYSFVKGVLVGPSGQRICNEMLYGAQIGQKMMHEHDGKGWVILDEKQYQAAGKDLTLKKGLWFHILLGVFYMKLGVKTANTIEGLAVKLNIPAPALKSTIDAYNAIANSDEQDPMGKPKENVQPIQGTKYYAIDTSYDYFYVPCPSLTLGGLAINEKSGLVLHENGQDIQGLYAAGRSAVGIPSKGYVSGLSIADCIFSGRRAAKHCATV